MQTLMMKNIGLLVNFKLVLKSSLPTRSYNPYFYLTNRSSLYNKSWAHFLCYPYNEESIIGKHRNLNLMIFIQNNNNLFTSVLVLITSSYSSKLSLKFCLLIEFGQNVSALHYGLIPNVCCSFIYKTDIFITSLTITWRFTDILVSRPKA